MERYDYRAAVTADVEEYIKEQVNLEDYAGRRNELIEELNDSLWAVDSVTGNGSGSYTFNAWKAEEYMCHNYDLLAEALTEFGSEDVQKYLESAETADVTIRCYLLGECIGTALENIEEELGIDLENGRCFEKDVTYSIQLPEGMSEERLLDFKDELESIFSEDGVQWNADNTAVYFPDIISAECEEIEEIMEEYQVAFERVDNDDYEAAMEAEAADASRFIANYDEENGQYFIFERDTDNYSFTRYQDKNGNFPAFDNKEDAIKYAETLENGKNKKRDEPER